MTYKVSMNVTADQIEGMIGQLPMKDKIRLVRKLEKQTWAKRLNEIFRNVDRRRKKLNISRKEIHEEIEKARQEFYVRNRH